MPPRAWPTPVGPPMLSSLSCSMVRIPTGSSISARSPDPQENLCSCSAVLPMNRSLLLSLYLLGLVQRQTLPTAAGAFCRREGRSQLGPRGSAGRRGGEAAGMTDPSYVDAVTLPMAIPWPAPPVLYYFGSGVTDARRSRPKRPVDNQPLAMHHVTDETVEQFDL